MGLSKGEKGKKLTKKRRQWGGEGTFITINV